MAKTLHTFTWQGIDAGGFRRNGECQAADRREVQAILQQQNILVLQINRQKKFRSFLSRGGIKPVQITQFIRELATLLSSGIPLVSSLGIIAENNPQTQWHALLVDMQKNIDNGQLLSATLALRPQYFDAIICNLVSVGEQSGLLELTLGQLADYREKMAVLKQKIKKAFFYPILVLITAAVIMLALLLWVIPEFSQLFNGLGAELPYFTRCIIRFTEQLRQYGGYLALSFLTFAFILKTAYARLFALQRRLASCLLKLPLSGSVYQAIILARCFKTLAITLRAGLPLLTALQLTAKISGNVIYESIWRRVADKINQGNSFKNSLSDCRYIPNRAQQLLAIGEESGQLEQMLMRLGDYYAAIVEHFITHLNQWLEPIIMIFLAVMIGALVIAVYLPVFQLGSVI